MSTDSKVTLLESELKNIATAMMNKGFAAAVAALRSKECADWEDNMKDYYTCPDEYADWLQDNIERILNG